jgi:hypothetical protein
VDLSPQLGLFYRGSGQNRPVTARNAAVFPQCRASLPCRVQSSGMVDSKSQLSPGFPKLHRCSAPGDFNAFFCGDRVIYGYPIPNFPQNHLGQFARAGLRW